MEFSNEQVWYYAKKDGSKFGPYTEVELIKLIKNELIQPSDYIWETDLDAWLKLEDTIYSIYCSSPQTSQLSQPSQPAQSSPAPSSQS